MGGREMKERVYRVASSRSFTRFLSLVAVAVVAFAALELLAVQPALAGKVCCTGTKNSAGAFNDCLCDGSVPATCDLTNKLSKVFGGYKNYTTGPVKTNGTLVGTLDKICNNTA